VTDSILGALVPVIIALSLTVTGVPLLTCLFAYSILGAYDYAHGLLTQYLEPQSFFLWKPAVKPASMARLDSVASATLFVP
jgi:hypothetical protein